MSLSLETANHTQQGEAATVAEGDSRQAETQQAQDPSAHEIPEKAHNRRTNQPQVWKRQQDLLKV